MLSMVVVMGDIPPPNALYPQPPAASQGLLAGDPAKAIGLLQGIAGLRGQNIANDTAIMEQQHAAQRAISSTMGGYLAGIPNPSADDVRSAAAFAARQYPQIATQYPDIITNVMGLATNHPKGVKYGASLLTNSQLTPAEVSGEVEGPPDPVTGARTVIKVPVSNMAPGRVVNNPMGSEDSSRRMQEDLARESSYATDVLPLKKSLELVKKLGPGGTAPGSKGRQEFESFVYGLMPQLVPAHMQDKIKNYAELEKYLVNNASLRAQNLGPHTNEGLATAVTGSPNVHINDLAAEDLIKVQLALRNMEHAQVIQAARGGGPNYTANKTFISSQHDPRAYAIATMRPEEIENLKKTLKGPERRRFNQSLRAAIDSGVIDRQ
jgi:hypothetical protein